MIEIFAATNPLETTSFNDYSIWVLLIFLWVVYVGTKYMFSVSPDPAQTIIYKILGFLFLGVSVYLGLNLYSKKDVTNVKTIIAIDNQYLKVTSAFNSISRINKEYIKNITPILKNKECQFTINFVDNNEIKEIVFTIEQEKVSHVKQCQKENNKSSVDVKVEQIPL